MIKKLTWDSEFFEVEVGELQFSEYDAALNFQDFDVLYISSESDFSLQLANFENSFSETKITFSKNLVETDSSSDTIFSISEIKYDTQKLYELAFESGKHSRFLLDEKFGCDKFKELYKKWIDNSISNKFATDILLFKKEGEIVGLLTYKIHNQYASVGLFAVANSVQGAGIGRQLLQKLEAVLFEQGVNKLEIPTQLSNSQACSFYKKSGYNTSNQRVIKHFWKK